MKQRPAVFAQLLQFSARVRKLLSVGGDRYLSKGILCPVPLLVPSSCVAKCALAGCVPEPWVQNSTACLQTLLARLQGLHLSMCSLPA